MSATPASARERIRLAVLQAAGAAYSRRPAPALPGDPPPQSVLLIRPDHLGDVLLLTPALRELRRALPHTRITLLLGPWSAAAVQNNGDFDELLTLPFPGFERRAKSHPLAPYRLLQGEARRLRARRFEAAVILRFDHWWGAWLAAAAGIPRRIGYDIPALRPFLTRPVPYTAGRHESVQNAVLLQQLAPDVAAPPGPTTFRPGTEDERWLAAWLRDVGIGSDERLIALHPGAGAAVKQWPLEKWAQVGAELATHSGARLVVTGGSGERELTARLAALLTPRLPAPALDLGGATALGQLAALYARCLLVLGADSGPLHLAVAVGAPTVHLYGPVPASKFGPWGNPARHAVVASAWACAPCDRLDWPPSVLADHACVVTIDVDRVVNAALNVLRGE